jgi:protein-tyrosine phosphatase
MTQGQDTIHAAATPARRISMDGASNFRDLGGYETGDGRRVRWRRVFRSGALDRLTDDDLVTLSALGLRTICDLRHDDERTRNPTRLPAENAPEAVHLPIRTRANAVLHAAIAGARDAAGAQAVADALAASYRCYVRDHADAYRGLLQRLADPTCHPLMFHCSAGKDRTGFGAALLLMTLGVPEETVFEDYRLTNTYWTEGRQRVSGDMPEAVRDAVIAANDAYLRAAIETLHEVHDSLDAYLRGPLGLSNEDVARLRDLLLE